MTPNGWRVATGGGTMAMQQLDKSELTQEMDTRMALLDRYGTMPAVFEAWRAGHLTTREQQALDHFRGTEVLLDTGLWRVPLRRSS